MIVVTNSGGDGGDARSCREGRINNILVEGFLYPHASYNSIIFDTD